MLLKYLFPVAKINYLVLYIYIKYLANIDTYGLLLKMLSS